MYYLLDKKTKEEIKKAEVKVTVGAGQTYLENEENENWTRIDINKDFKPDIVHDLTQTPWPLEDNSVDVIFGSHIIEHLPSLEQFVNEAERALKPGGILVLLFPHYSRVWFSNEYLGAYGIGILRGFNKFTVEKVHLKYTWWRWRHWYKIPVYAFLAVMEFFANLNPAFWERIWCYWFGGFDHVMIRARKNK